MDESQRNIQSNSRLLQDRLRSTFSDDSNLLCAFGAFIVQRCFLVAVSTPSQQSAFRVFSVLNNRGLDLLPTDIVKADVIGRISKARQDEITEKWEELEVQTGRNGFNDLFGHIRMIYAKEKVKRALLEEFKEHVLSVIPSLRLWLRKYSSLIPKHILSSKSSSMCQQRMPKTLTAFLVG